MQGLQEKACSHYQVLSRLCARQLLDSPPVGTARPQLLQDDKEDHASDKRKYGRLEQVSPHHFSQLGAIKQAEWKHRPSVKQVCWGDPVSLTLKHYTKTLLPSRPSTR